MKKLLFIIAFLMGLLSCSNTDVDINASVAKTLSGITVLNNDDFKWENVKITINDDYKCNINSIDQKEKKTINFFDFVLKDGTMFDISTKKIVSVTVSCKVREDEIGFGYYTFSE